MEKQTHSLTLTWIPDRAPHLHHPRLDWGSINLKPSAPAHIYPQSAQYRLHPNTSPTSLQSAPKESHQGFPKHEQTPTGIKVDWFSVSINSLSPLVTLAVPDTTIQCSAQDYSPRNKGSCPTTLSASRISGRSNH